jgi:holo-[acyl-carrier protein] synthase
MILGIGIDIIEVSRIQSSHERFGERFLNRILLPNEISYCLSYKAPGPFLAVRFAAKEAISKAFGTGIGAQLGWQDMEVGRKESGEPFVILHERGRKLLQARGGRSVLISLSHTQNYAAAVAVLEGGV